MKYASNGDPWMIENLYGWPRDCIVFAYEIDARMETSPHVLSACSRGRPKKTTEQQDEGPDAPDWMRKVQTYD